VAAAAVAVAFPGRAQRRDVAAVAVGWLLPLLLQLGLVYL